MSGPVVTSENVHQLVQAMYENVKSNQHRIDEMRPVLNTMSVQVGRLNSLLVENGYAKAAKDSARELKELRTDFNEYVLHREESCPVARRLAQQKLDEQSRKNWGATVLKLVFAGIGGISTLIIIIQTFMHVIGG